MPLMTSSRPRPRYQLAIEALVLTTAAPARVAQQLPEHRRICALCREVRSVAEAAALLDMPLGIARILIADLAEAGLVTIHQPATHTSTDGAPDTALLGRVLRALRGDPPIPPKFRRTPPAASCLRRRSAS
ncbi:DUF742 domain-containing protein [Streptomyces spectabilis]|uniref:DUF742 domain-containing protein n=1 Tax=Streptomyces spectabilis TaxID=68270 RepID=A0A7W8B360_STRST|nr:hypothetical protein [Streptomyces spectabilis]GGV53481.1 hypothetical protein GCM10010245_84450 [Streptomyces spectabilis]